jgi:hypothetical protein
MKRIFLFILISLVLSGLFYIAAAKDNGKVIDGKSPATTGPALQKQVAVSKGRLKLDQDFGKLPLYFTENKGQVNAKATFYAKTSKYNLWLTKKGLVFDSKRIPVPKNGKRKITNQNPASKIEREVTKLTFAGANPNPKIVPIAKTNYKRNFLIGKNKSKWQTDVPTFQKVVYKNLYNNIDLKVSGKKNQVEYDWIVKPGGNPTDIKIEYKGAVLTGLDKKGNLIIETKFGKLCHKRPESYQVITTGEKESRVPVDVTFKRFAKNRYGFSTGKYDQSRALIIDPLVLAYSTYIGGSNEDYGMGIAVDNNGCAYIVGYTDSADFPMKNSYSEDLSETDVFVTKIDTTESGSASLICSTYLGGGSIDKGQAIAVDGAGSVYLTGITKSHDFPVVNQFKDDLSNFDTFISRIDPNPEDNGNLNDLKYSTYTGAQADDGGFGIAVDNNKNAYVTGYAKGNAFPLINQCQGDQGGDDAFLVKIDTGSSGINSFLYSSYLGGNGEDKGTGIAVDNYGNAYITGYTISTTNFPTTNGYDTTLGSVDYYDVFVTKIDTTISGPNGIEYSTYLGGVLEDKGASIVLGSNGIVYITGCTTCTDFPVLGQYQSDPGDNDYDAFVAKIDTTESGTSSLICSTYLGGDAMDKGYAIALNSFGDILVTGTTYSSDFPLLEEYQGNQDYWDVFITTLQIDGTGVAVLKNSTYLGDDGYDEGHGIAADSSLNIFVTGYTTSTGFPTTDNAYDNGPNINSIRHAFVTKLRPGTLTLTNPNGGQILSAGSNTYITWTGGDSIEDNLDIKLYKDDELECVIVSGIDPLNDGGSGTGSYNWAVGSCEPGNSAAAGTGYKIKIEEVGTTVSDMSDAPFEITSGIAIISPTTGTEWGFELTENILCTAPAGDYKITLLKDGKLFGTISEFVTHDGQGQITYPWVVGVCINSITAPPDSGYTIKVEEIGQSVSAVSGIFDITGINITSPTGGEEWEFWKFKQITWQAHKLTQGNVQIILKKNGVILAKHDYHTDFDRGEFNWLVGELELGAKADPGDGYTIWIGVEGTIYDCDETDPFEITGIRITSPIGGELLDIGINKYRNITWASNRVTSNLTIILKKRGEILGNIVSNISPGTSPGSSSYYWKVGDYNLGEDTAPPGYAYTIQIKETGTTASHQTDSFYLKGVNILSPDGVENWQIGTIRQITWEAPGIPSSHKLLISLYKLIEGEFEYYGKIVGSRDPEMGYYYWYAGKLSDGTIVPPATYGIEISSVDGSDIQNITLFL